MVANVVEHSTSFLPLYDIAALSRGREGKKVMKNTLKTAWMKFVNYLNAPVGSRNNTAMGSYAGLCGLGHSDDSHH
jgi:hypothetical protein